MLRWPHSLFPQFHQDENLIVFILTFLNSMGFPLPGEPILFGAGFILGKKGILPGGPIAAGITACVLAGEIAFWLGRRFGHSHFRKIHWLHLTPEKFEWMEQFFKRYGAKMVFIARFIALIPPPMPNLLAGMAEMRWRVFIFYNLAGSVVYVTGYILLGYLFGKQWNRGLALRRFT